MTTRPRASLAVCVGAIALLGSCGRIGFELLGDEQQPSTPDGGPLDAAHDAPDAPIPCIPPCANGTCVAGACECMPGWIGPQCDAPSPLGSGTDGAVVFSGAVNLSRENAPGRTCSDGGDGVSYSVVGLTERSATLSAAPSAGCLTTGDAVLLINLQGAPGAVDNVGQHEFLLVESVSGDRVTFTTDKLQHYGATLDDGLGTARGTQRVVLQRVPQYSDVTVSVGATLTADPWDGARGGVLALRATGSVRIDGRVTMDRAGYAGAPPTATPGAPGVTGESFTGLGTASLLSLTGGGGGGLGSGADAACGDIALPGGGGGHAEAGENPGTTSCTPESPAVGGGPYGDAFGTRLFLGSGGGAGGAHTSLGDNPPGGAGGAGGGIIAIFAGRVLGSGTLSAAGGPGQGDASGTVCDVLSADDCWELSGPGGGGAGGIILGRSPIFSVATVQALGGSGGSGLASGPGNGGRGGNGYTVIAGLP
jgi:hypothetical protein